MTKKVLTGIKPTGVHLGNWKGAIEPSLKLLQEDVSTVESSAPAKKPLGFFFLADLHALNSTFDPKVLSQNIIEVAATWLALGLDPKESIFYKQSDIPEISELATILACFTPKGLLNRAHAYKAKVALNEEQNKKDLDDGVNMGLYTYPLLMTADILAFNADVVPVGEDNTQHLEIARDIAGKFNRNYKDEIFRVPELKVRKGALLEGMDGRKMSASYNNHIPVFLPEKKLRKKIMKITTDSTPPEDPKRKSANSLFSLYSEFASSAQIQELEKKYQEGISWGEVKQELFEVLNATLSEPRKYYDHLVAHPQEVEQILKEGAEKAREYSRVVRKDVKQAIGVSF